MKPQSHRLRPHWLSHRKARLYWLIMLSVALGAFVLRAWHIRNIYYSPVSDMVSYLAMMDALFVKHDWMNIWSTMFPPGYPFFLHLSSRITGLATIKPILLVQALADSLTIFAVGATARGLYGARASIVAAVLFAFYKYQILNCGLLLSESLSLDLVVIVLWLVTRFCRRPSWTGTAVIGIAVALASHFRTNLLTLVVPACIYMALCGARRVSPGSDWSYGKKALLVATKPACAFALCLVLLVPWSIRNSIISGRPTFVADNAGLNLLQGNNPISEGGWVVMSDLPDPWAVKTGGPEGLRAMGDSGRKYVRSHLPNVLFYIWPRRLKHLFIMDEAHYPWEEAGTFTFWTHPFGPIWWFPLVGFRPVLFLGIVGFFAPSKRARYMLLVAWVALVAPLLLPPANIRYRLVSDIPLIIASAGLMANVFRMNPGGRVLRNITFAYVSIVGIGTLVNALRFGGPDLVQTQSQWGSRSDELQTLASGGILRNFRSGDGAPSIELGELRVNSAEISHLLVRFDYEIDPTAPIASGRSINLHFTYLDDKHTTVTRPPVALSMPSGNVTIGAYQKRGVAWKVILVPPLARMIRLKLTSSVPRDYSISHLEIRGPIWCGSGTPLDRTSDPTP